MNWIDGLGNINYWGVTAAAFSSFVLGFVWYLWPVFGKPWAKSLGITKTEADNTDGLGGVFLMSIVGGVATAILLAVLMKATGTDGLVEGAIFGALIGFVFRYLSSLLYHNGFARRPMQLTTIDGGYDIVQLVIMGALIGFIG